MSDPIAFICAVRVHALRHQDRPPGQAQVYGILQVRRRRRPAREGCRGNAGGRYVVGETACDVDAHGLRGYNCLIPCPQDQVVTTRGGIGVRCRQSAAGLFAISPIPRETERLTRYRHLKIQCGSHHGLGVHSAHGH